MEKPFRSFISDLPYQKPYHLTYESYELHLKVILFVNSLLVGETEQKEWFDHVNGMSWSHPSLYGLAFPLRSSLGWVYRNRLLPGLQSWYPTLVELFEYDESLVREPFQFDPSLPLDHPYRDRSHLLQADKIWALKSVVPYLSVMKRIPGASRDMFRLTYRRMDWGDHGDLSSWLTVNMEYRLLGIRVREYQEKAIQEVGEQSGVVVMPCGSGKTVVGSLLLRFPAMIVVTTRQSARQWLHHLMRYTTLNRFQVSLPGENPADVCCIVTYHGLPDRCERHFEVQILDEVQRAPAAVFSQCWRSVRHVEQRVGLTATWVREDGKLDLFEREVGPVLYSLQLRPLVRQGFLSNVRICVIHTSDKVGVSRWLVDRHKGQATLVTSERLDILRSLRGMGDLCMGTTPHGERDVMLSRFRRGITKVLRISSVGDDSLDLPRVSVGIVLNFFHGSRCQPAQRVGRLQRHQNRHGVCYFLVSPEEERWMDKALTYLSDLGYRSEHWWYNDKQ